jgi:hypothetical protein
VKRSCIALYKKFDMNPMLANKASTCQQQLLRCKNQIAGTSRDAFRKALDNAVESV